MAINPATPVEALLPFADRLDILLIMTVVPGGLINTVITLQRRPKSLTMLLKIYTYKLVLICTHTRTRTHTSYAPTHPIRTITPRLRRAEIYAGGH